MRTAQADHDVAQGAYDVVSIVIHDEDVVTASNTRELEVGASLLHHPPKENRKRLSGTWVRHQLRIAMHVALGDKPHAIVVTPSGTWCNQISSVDIAHEVRRHLLQVIGQNRMDEIGGAGREDTVRSEREMSFSRDARKDLLRPPVALIAGYMAKQPGAIEVGEDMQVLTSIQERYMTQHSPIVLFRNSCEPLER